MCPLLPLPCLRILVCCVLEDPDIRQWNSSTKHTLQTVLPCWSSESWRYCKILPFEWNPIQGKGELPVAATPAVTNANTLLCWQWFNDTQGEAELLICENFYRDFSLSTVIQWAIPSRGHGWEVQQIRLLSYIPRHFWSTQKALMRSLCVHLHVKSSKIYPVWVVLLVFHGRIIWATLR